MDCIILAAGKGTRLGKITDEVPKPLVEVKGKPIIEHQIEELSKKFKNFFFIVGYKKEKIIDFVEKIKDRYGINAEYIVQENPLGVAQAISLLPEKISDPFFLTAGDIIFEIPDLDGIPTIFTLETEDTKNKGVVEIFEGKVSKIYYSESSLPGKNLIDAAFAILPKESIKYSKSFEFGEKEISFASMVNGMVKEGQTFLAKAYHKNFIHITKESDLESANRNY